MRRGVSLLELLIVVAMIGFIMAGVSRAYISVLDADGRLREGRERQLKIPRFEDRLRQYLSHAYLSADAADTSTFFIGGDSNLEGTAGPATTLVMTAIGLPVSSAMLTSTDDFETLNDRYGPQGGVDEISMSTTAVGQAPDSTGFFIREQRPSDGDPTQGGYERVFSKDVENVTFEFFDGVNWMPTWDTRTMGTKRLPAAVRVSYNAVGDDTQRQLIVRLPLSDVTPTDPVTEETAQ